jgi:predicted MFS family arabinose efflux permease
MPETCNKLFPILGTYDLNILLRTALIIIVTILCAIFLKEVRTREKQASHLKAHILESARFIKGSRTVLLLAAGMFCVGFFIFTVETYWQPAYVDVLRDESLSWTLGLMSFGCFLFASLGNILIKKIFISRQRIWYIGYAVSRLGLFAALAVFSLMQSAVSFAAMFFAVYFLFGASNMAESTMLNMEIPSEKRASMLSFVSFVFQIGGIVAPAAAALASTQPGVRTLWLLSGAIFFIVSAFIAFALLKLSRKRNAAATQRNELAESSVSETDNCADAAKT